VYNAVRLKEPLVDQPRDEVGDQLIHPALPDQIPQVSLHLLPVVRPVAARRAHVSKDTVGAQQITDVRVNLL
jgi:hypothetical protein